MNLRSLLCIFLVFIFQAPCLLQGRLIESSYPYLSGDTFRSFCDFSFDEITTSFDPENVQTGDFIFVKTDMLKSFFQKKHPFIKHPYCIVSHNSDHPAPGPGKQYLDDPKIIVWFAQNVEYIHPKLHPIPIGMANKMWPHGDISVLDKYRQMSPLPRKKLLYMNFSIGTFPSERKRAFQYFINKPYCFYSPAKTFDSYIRDLLDVRFSVSPRGNGLDCHRTWEALYMGAIPIVKESPMDSLFEELPVLIVKDWQEITEDFLQNKYQKIMLSCPKDEKLYADYWKTLFDSYKNKAKG